MVQKAGEIGLIHWGYKCDYGLYTVFVVGNWHNYFLLWVELVSTTDQSEEEGGIKKEEMTGDDSTCTEDEFADTLEAPVIHEINPALINTTPGQKITIQVSFTSEEKPSIEWRKGGLLLKTGEGQNKVWSV